MSESKFKHLETVREMIEACFRCGDCRTAVRPEVGRDKVCPVYETIPGKWEPFFARGKIMLANGLLKGDIAPRQELADIIFQCMICGSCQTTCNNSYHPSLKHPTHEVIDHPKIWEALRADLVEAGFLVSRHGEIMKSCETNYNPYFEEHVKRTNWVPAEKKFPEKAEYILFMGCTEPYRIPEILQKLIKILDYANIKYTILGTEEWCCGSVALRTGNRELAKKLALHNFEAFTQVGATHIITHCAGCYRTLKMDYKELLPEFDFEVLHVLELIQKLLDNGDLKFLNEVPQKVTYHDPCHLGRHSKVYDAPRYILNKIPGLEFIEMRRIKENSWCCGAGGGMKSGFSELAVQIAKTRIEEALETNATKIVTACPFCLRNLQDGINNLAETRIDVIDILDLILLAIEKQKN
ncbi:MAG: (Fe-S)-binding protein [Candidatus Helarchaeota archaeon]